MMRQIRYVMMAAAICALIGCSSKDRPNDKKDGGPAKAAVAVETVAVATSDLEQGVDVVGTLAPKVEAEVKSQIPGLIKEIAVTEWVSVRKGDLLARIDVSETEAAVEAAKAGLAQAEAASQRADREKVRLKKLLDFGLATQQNYDDAESEAAAARARANAAAAQIKSSEARLAKGQIIAPIDGVVASRDVNVGDLASDTGAAKTLFRIVDNRIMKLTATVPSVDMAKIRIGNRISFTVDALPGRTFSGQVMFVNPSVNENDRSVRVVAEVQNATGELKGGLFAKGRIQTGVRSRVILVPRAALTGLDVQAKQAGLFVEKDGVATYRTVEVGVIAGDQVELLKGLAAGERLVVRGGFNLKDGDKVLVAAGQGR